MVYGLDASKHRNIIAGGDSHGFIHFIDARERSPIGSYPLHKKGNKVSVTSIPAQQNSMCE